MTENGKRQFVKYSFYKLDKLWRVLPEDEKARGKDEFLAILDEFSEFMMIRTYSTVGMRGDTDFLIWEASERLETVQQVSARLLSSGLGKYLDTPYSYLAMTRPSVYLDNHKHAGQEGRRKKVKPVDSKYFFVYPFVKTRNWYQLDQASRQGMMNAHIQTGHKYPSVKINTAYSFGLDDQEFVVAFETDSPSDFLDLVMDLRGSDASSYTLRDTPIFTCIAMSPRETLDSLGE